MSWKTILVPHDLSPCADHAAALAQEVARAHGARLVVLYVADLPMGLDPDALVVPREGAAPVRARDLATGGAEAQLEVLAARLAADGVAVTTSLVLGDVVDEILAAAHRERADLIVMGTHGRTGLSHLVVGSVTEKVVRQAPVPVLTRRGATG
jgi:universal stress protein A